MPLDLPHAPTRRTALALGAVGLVAALTGCSAPGSRSAAEVAAGPQASLATVRPRAATVVQQRTVRLTGRNLAGVHTVEFGDQSARVLSRTATSLTVSAPAASDYQPGVVPVVLKAANGSVIAVNRSGYEYTVAGGVAAQLTYALAHWDNYNTAQYGDLNPDGGDCANFVSQTLIARGWQMNDDWYNDDAGSDVSDAWGYVPSMDEYFSDQADTLGLTQLSFDQGDRRKVALGDVAVFYWGDDTIPDHVEIVDRITHQRDGVTRIALASHNDDYAFRDLDDTITNEHPGSTGHFWHLTQ